MFSVVVIAVCAFSSPGSVYAEWPPDGKLVCGFEYDQSDPKIVSDGAGGMIVAWTDTRSGSADVYAQRVDGSGNPVWSPDGIPIRAGTDEFELVEMVTDGVDGAILLWTHNGEDIHAQHVDGAGTLHWGTTGTQCPVSDPPGDFVAVPDGAGGVIFAWVEARTSHDDVIAQRIDANGFEVWTHGGIFVIDPGLLAIESDPCITADGSGGAVIAAVSGTDIRVQRIYASGADWTAAGVVVTPTHPVNPLSPAITGDGAGGAYVAWHDGPPSDTDIFVNWVDGAGSVQWPSGKTVCSAIKEQTNPDIIHVESGNTAVCWEDRRDDFDMVYVQMFDMFGTMLWTTDGVALSIRHDDKFEPKFISSGAPELIVAWFDTRGGENITAQKIDVGGGTVWAPDAVRVINGELYVGGYDFESDNAGGLIAAVVNGTDIFAQAINARGKVYAAEPTIAGIADVPDDQGGWVRITIGPSDRDTVGVMQEPAARYDVWQQIDPAAAPPAQAKSAAASSPVGVVSYEWNGTRYITAAPGAVVPEGTWELVGSFAASQDTQYVYRAPTPADSSDAGTSYSTYFVSAHTTIPMVWFASEADSGYSVDNIPPHVPTGFAVAYNTGSGNQLAWDDCPDDDFKYFRVYRSETPGFVPSQADYVHGVTDSDWLDPVAEGWKYHYKIAAVDMADNESGTTGGTATGADGPSAPDRLALHQNVPNPFNPTTTISIGMPVAGRVRLTVYSIAGALVRTLVDRRVPAGVKSFTWNGADNTGNRASSGVYFYRLEAGGEIITKKMVLLK
jgi:hypothetical protein